MKVYELVSVMDLTDFVEIHADDSLEWGEENPYTMETQKVRELSWVFMEKVGKREVASIGLYGRYDGEGSYLSIRYK